MNYMLDTNVCIKLLNLTSKPIAKRFQTIQRNEIVLCQIVKAELYFGAYKSQRQEANLRLLAEFFHATAILSFDDQAAKRYGMLHAELDKSGSPIGQNDLQIAAIAMRYGVTLVTHNMREFQRVPGLLLEDWEEEGI